ncbi:MAG: hypothetical protein JOY64_30990 [Alphaproteobacteria bacterium]|nr:hypothetical protein [Alphaproteobacteria bacterium]
MRIWLSLLLAVAVLSSPSLAQGQDRRSPGRILGNIDGISRDGEQYFLSGWACQQGRKESIDIHVYAAAPSQAKRVFVTANHANFQSEATVNGACHDTAGGQHRFLVALPFGYTERNLYDAHGIRLVDGVPNDAISGSGKPLRDLGVPSMPFRSATVPPLSGTYVPSPAHPRVFVTPADLKDLVARINRPNTYSAQRFHQLADQIARDLASRRDWDATYAGCTIGPYLYAFSYEPEDGHEAETHAALKLAPGVQAPAGGAVVAARLALYAALVKNGALAPRGAPSADPAAALAKRILLAWADRGFPRDKSGHILSLSAVSCDASGKIAAYAGWALPLQLGRGVVYSVQAQDLLQSIGALDGSEEARANALHGALFELIRQGYNQSEGRPQPDCQRYTNGDANGTAALLAIARLLDDPHRFDAVLRGGDRSLPVLLPWLRLFDGAIYGENDRPLACYPNTGPDGLHSGSGFTTPVVAPGEVQDRYRAGVLQTFGYPMFTLERLIDAAEVLRNAGFDPYHYRGNHKQSLEMALQYYACYGKTPGFFATVTRDNARACANFEQYYGKVVNGVDANIVIGAFRLPENLAITDVERAAKEKAATGAFALNAILFGKWRD